MNREITEEMNALSKEAYGSSSRWRKLMEKGVPQLWEREKEVMVPSRKGGIDRKVYKEHKYGIKRYSLEEVKEEMLKIIAGRKEIALALQDLPTTKHAPSVQAIGSLEPGMSVSLEDGTILTVSE